MFRRHLPVKQSRVIRKLNVEQLENREVPATIVVTAWLDQNGDGVQDAGDGVLANVGVSITQPDGEVVIGATGADGTAEIDVSGSGSTNYEITISYTAPDGYAIETPADGQQGVNVTDENSTIGVGVGLSSASSSGSGSGGPTNTDQVSTFTLSDGNSGTLTYDVPWESVDPNQASQSLPVSNFSLALAGQTFTDANANYITSPTVQFQYGVVTGVTFGIDTSGVAGYPYTGVSMSGTTLTAALPAPQLPLTTSVADPQAQYAVDFTPVTTGKSYRIEIKLFDTGGPPAQVGSTQIITVGPAATRNIIRGLFKTAMENLDLTCTFPAGNNNLAVITGPAAGPGAFGYIQYRTLVKTDQGNWVQSADSGPAFDGKLGTADFFVNGTKLGR